MSQSIIPVLLRGIHRVTKSRDSTLASVLCCIVCATVLMFTPPAGAYTYTYTDGVFTGSFRVSGTAVDPDTGLINTDPNSNYFQVYILVDGNWGPWSNTSALTVDSYSFSGLGYTFSMAVDHPAPNSVAVYVNHQGQIVDWSWTIYDGAWPSDTVAYLYLYGGPANVGNANPRPDQENLYIEKPSYNVVRHTNTGTWTGSADTPSSLTIASSGNGSGMITSSPSGINCGSTCTASYTSGASVTLTGTPSSGSCFIGWGTPCSGYGTCNLTLTGDTSLTATFQPVGINFCDVTPGTWAETYINTLFSHGVTTGCVAGTTPDARRYCPSDLVTRAQMAAFVIRTKEDEPSTSCADGSPFTDVDQNDWSCKYIKRLKELKLATGYGGDPTIYMPNLTVPRDQMAAFIIRATVGEAPTDYCASGSPFTDVPASSWACPDIKRLKELNLTTGYGGDPTIYKPSLMVPRDQMATFLARAFYGMH